MAVACGLAVSNLYYNQPLLGLIARGFPGSSASIVGPSTQLGYAIGLLSLVPLGDMFDRRKLVVVQFLALAICATLVASAPSASGLVVASFLLGVFATVAQQILPLAAQLAPEKERGAIMGKVMAGLLCGILLSRVISGAIGEALGWRAMFWLGASLSLVGAALMVATLPAQRKPIAISYPTLLRSLRQIWIDLPELRVTAISQALLFGSFCVFWNVLAFHLQEPTFSLGPQAAGMFGVAGAAGVLIAPYAGKFADKRGPRSLIIAGAFGIMFAWIMLIAWSRIAGMIVGVVLLDLAYHCTVIGSQHIVYALRPEARSRVNTLFVGAIFMGGTSGAIIAQISWNAGGWVAVGSAGVALCASSLLWQYQHR
ncbi:MFS transporter [Sphingobium sp. BHU LFT2]|nr:MFS transporter [Sphingobium sp. BHU LFT2]MBT2246275.1 MFS transporter [Sphingobium sp. BHU LFT2]